MSELISKIIINKKYLIEIWNINLKDNNLLQLWNIL